MSVIVNEQSAVTEAITVRKVLTIVVSDRSTVTEALYPRNIMMPKGFRISGQYINNK